LKTTAPLPMKFKAPNFDIPSEDPFKNDLLERKDCANGLKEFVEHLSESFVLAIDSPWGTGKTTFLKMWMEMLTTAGIRHLYFSAWENDFSDSPLISLIAEIGRIHNDNRKKTEAFQKVKNIGAALFKTATPSVLKIVTSGLVDLKGIGEEMGKVIEEVAKKKIEKYDEDKKSIIEFRKCLIDLVKESSDGQTKDSAKPVVFIIDELDRCRPHYAIELLENVKHLFNVEGLVFVLAIDKKQLAESVKSLYGNGFDANDYLKRFIDLEFTLPRGTIDIFMRSQLARFGITELIQKRNGDPQTEIMELIETLAALCSLFNFSLRTQEQCFTQIALIVRMTERNHHIFAPLLAILVCLRIQNPILFTRYTQDKASPEQVIEYIRSLASGHNLQPYIFWTIEGHLIGGLSQDERDKEKNRHYLISSNPAGPVPSVREKSAFIYKILQKIPYAGNPTLFLSKKIDFTQPFVPFD
jgi:hypothetical protein